MFCSFTQSRFIIFPAVAVAVHFDIEMQAGNGVGAVFAHGGGLRHAEDHFESDIADDSALVQMMKPLPIGSRVALKADCAWKYGLDAGDLAGTVKGVPTPSLVSSVFQGATDTENYVLVNFDQWPSDSATYVVSRLDLDPRPSSPVSTALGPAQNSAPNTGMAPIVPPPTGGQALRGQAPSVASQLTPDAPNTDSPSRVELKAYLQKTLTELQRAIAEM